MGALTLVLAIGAFNGFVLANLLAVARANRRANLILALLIAAISWRAGSYILGYAGAYDANRWLTFFPFDLSLAYGPLLWFYVRQLTTGSLPAAWRWHLAPVAVQLLYLLACFALPLDAKWSWYTGAHLQVVAPIGAAAALASCAFYLYRSFEEARSYGAWLDRAYANRDEARLVDLRLLLGAFGITLGIAILFAAFSWLIQPLDYFERFPLMVVFALLTYALGLLGWRNASVDYPHRAQAETTQAPGSASAEDETQDENRRKQGETYRERLAASDWWRDEDFDLATFAEKLGVSTRTLSRALSEGLGCNFRELVGRIRVEAVAAKLDQEVSSETLLDIALAAGFKSKASFNRAFLAYRGVTPSAYRAARDQKAPNAAQGGP